MQPDDRLQFHAKWKAEIEDKLRERRKHRLRADVIVRDAERLDGYPHATGKKGRISPWFRAGLVGTYHGGVSLLLRYEEPSQCITGGYRLANYAAGETGELTAALIGYVPYEQIVHIDWDGDEFYGFPVLFCYFDADDRTPYERVAYCYERTITHPEGDRDYYIDIADAHDLRRRSRRVGVRR